MNIFEIVEYKRKLMNISDHQLNYFKINSISMNSHRNRSISTNILQGVQVDPFWRLTPRPSEEQMIQSRSYLKPSRKRQEEGVDAA